MITDESEFQIYEKNHLRNDELKSLKCKRKKKCLYAKYSKKFHYDENYCEEFKTTQGSGDFICSQIDGANDLEEETLSATNVYSVNCEIYEIHLVINFLRSFVFLWKLSTNHPKCDFNTKHKELNCFFCNVRSSLLRLNVKRMKGPKSLKPYEFIS